METKLIAFLLVGIVVGAGVGIGVGYFVFNEDVQEDPTYWFYIDFEGGVTDFESGWVSAKATNTTDAFFKALGNERIPYEYSTAWGIFVSSIGGLSSVNVPPYSPSWMMWDWSGSEWVESMGIADSTAKIMFIGYTELDAEFSPMLDLDKVSGWKNTGPFKK